MKKTVISIVIPSVAVILAVVFICLWYRDLGVSFVQRIPGTDKSSQQVVKKEAEYPTEVQGVLEQLDGAASDLPGEWRWFRGKNYDCVYHDDNITLARGWPEGGPRLLWEIPVGEGYAGAAILNGRVYLLDYDRERGGDLLRCISLADGKDIWRYWYPVKVKRNHGMSRTVPAVTEQYVVVLGPKCHVTCLDSATGRYLWAISLVEQFGATVPLWYAGQCPLIEDGKVIVAPGGEALMIAVDCQSGEIIWKTPNPNGWKMTHATILPLEFNGQRMYVYCGSGGVVGTSARDGEILWDTTEWMIRTATVPTPVNIGDGRIFFSGGYNKGSMMLKLHEEADSLRTEVLYSLDAKIFGAEQHTPILYDGFLYGVRQEDAQLVCMDLEGNVLWTGGSEYKIGAGPGSGPYMIGNGLIYALSNEGILYLVEATSAGFRLLDKAHVIEGHEPWGPMAMAGGRLILRNLDHMICIDVSSGTEQAAGP